ncbi:MAG: hypothetical protein E7157_02820 [Lactobacillales bacterium]|nr:hypothetical protein [Lactobacillales bacterium]
MKNIFKIIIFLLVFSIGKVNAENFYEDNYVTGVFATYQKNDFIKAQQMRFIRRYGDNIAAYCLTPEETIYEDEKYTARFSNQSIYLNISKEKYKRISEIAYFGYNYKNHTDIKWYAITQVMLWKEMEPNSDVFYTDKIKGNKIERFTLEEQEIENLIKNYNLLPNISDLDLTVNKEYQINDSNNILNEYEIEKNNLLDIKINNNKLVINPKEKGTFKIKLIRKDGTHSHTTIPYTASKGQDILVRGSIDRPYKEITINVTGGDLEIKKIDSETLSTESRGEASIVGANYKLYDDDNNLVDTLVINNEGIATINDLEYGNYTLKESLAPTGYKIDPTTYQINIDSNNESLELKEEIIKGKLIINKYLKDKKLSPEANISFKIFDSNNNLVDEITTNNLGQVSIELIYGKYKVVQQNTTKGYKKVEDFYITIDSTEDKIIDLEDEIIIKNIKEENKIDDNKPNNTDSNEIVDKNSKDNLNNNKKENNNIQNIIKENITTIYPKTSNTDIYINSIICYLSLFGVILIISGFKSEKIRNFFNNSKHIIISNKKRNRKL